MLYIVLYTAVLEFSILAWVRLLSFDGSCRFLSFSLFLVDYPWALNSSCFVTFLYNSIFHFFHNILKRLLCIVLASEPSIHPLLLCPLSLRLVTATIRLVRWPRVKPASAGR